MLEALSLMQIYLSLRFAATMYIMACFVTGSCGLWSNLLMSKFCYQSRYWNIVMMHDAKLHHPPRNLDLKFECTLIRQHVY